MEFSIYFTPRFEKDIHFYKTKRKYKKIDDDVDDVVKQLQNGNLLGDEIQDLKLSEDESTYKVRIVNTSINVGKSKGFRMIYYVVKNECEIYLLTIYSKTDKEDISNKEIIRLILEYCR